MIKMPYFMSNKSWYKYDGEQNYILTKDAPVDAIEDYNKHKLDYQNKVKNMSVEEYLEFCDSEDGWLSFPIDDEKSLVKIKSKTTDRKG